MMWSLMIWTPLLGRVCTTCMNYTHMLIEHTCAVISWWIALRGRVRIIIYLKDLYDLQGLYNVDVSLFFWRWDLLGLDFCTCVRGGMIWTPCCVHDVEDLHEWSKGPIVYTLQLTTEVCLERQLCLFRIISTLVPGGIWLISMTFQMFSRKGI